MSETPDVPIIRQQPGIKEADRIATGPKGTGTKAYYGEVSTNATDAQTNMVRAGVDFTWEDFTAGNAMRGAPGHIRFYDRRQGKFYRVPMLHSSWDDT